jgi:hypothetical protein
MNLAYSFLEMTSATSRTATPFSFAPSPTGAGEGIRTLDQPWQDSAPTENGISDQTGPAPT